MDDMLSPPTAGVEPVAFHGAVGAQRHALVQHAYQLAGDFGARSPAEQLESVPQLSGLLAAALEQLRLAEEELRLQNDELVRSRKVAESQLVHFQELFDLAPIALIVTDSYGGVTEVNDGAAQLTGRPRERMLRQPIATFVPQEHRRAFRDGFSHLVLAGGADHWRVVIDRLGAQVEVSAVVKVLDRTVGRGSLFWALHPSNPEASFRTASP